EGRYRGLNWIVDCSVDRSQIVHEFGGLNGEGVRYIDDVLIAHLESRCEEVARGVAEIDVVDHGNYGTLKIQNVDTHRLRDVTGFAAIEKYRSWIGLVIQKAAGLADGLGERDAPGAKGNLLLGS